MADLLGFLHQSRRSGRLVVASDGVERTLVFKDGEVRSAQSTMPGERLGEVAIKLGFVSEIQLVDAARSVGDGPIGKALTDRGHISASDLWRCIHEQVATVFHALLPIQQGVFWLIDQDLGDRLGAPLAVTTQSLLMDGIRRIDELSLFQARIPGPGAYLRRREPKRQVTLKALEQQLLALVDGQRTVAQVATAAHLNEFDAIKVLYHLAEAGYLEALAAPAPQAGTPDDRVEAILAGMNGLLRTVTSAVELGQRPAFLASVRSHLRRRAGPLRAALPRHAGGAGRRARPGGAAGQPDGAARADGPAARARPDGAAPPHGRAARAPLLLPLPGRRADRPRGRRGARRGGAQPARPARGAGRRLMDPLPYATAGLPGSGGEISATPEDFRVDERPAYLPAGSGPHLYLHVEKRGRTTRDVVRELSRRLGVPDRDAGYAGLKDKAAVTTQWLSFPVARDPDPASLEGPGYRVLTASRHQNKLRAGHARGNAFAVAVRGGDLGRATRLRRRAGRDRPAQLLRPAAVRPGRRDGRAGPGPPLARARRPRRAAPGAIASCAAWPSPPSSPSSSTAGWPSGWPTACSPTALAGDVLKKLDTGGLFTCQDPAVDGPRVARFEVSPAGPMFGHKLGPGRRPGRRAGGAGAGRRRGWRRPTSPAAAARRRGRGGPPASGWRRRWSRSRTATWPASSSPAAATPPWCCASS